MIIEAGNTLFKLDPDMVFTGDENNQEEVNSFESFKQIHVAMSQEFEDEANLNYFKTLLSNDPNTAFLIYNNSKGRTLS